MTRAALLALLALTACRRSTPITSCRDDLRGVYATGAGAAGDVSAAGDAGSAGEQRWMVLDRGATLEAYPLFPDGEGGAGAPRAGSAGAAVAPVAGSAGPAAAPVAGSAGATGADGEMVVAPRAIELTRGPDGLAGTLRRRYMQRSAICEARVPVHVARCAQDTLELVLAEPSPPLGFAPCTWLRPGPSRVVRWRRVP